MRIWGIHAMTSEPLRSIFHLKTGGGTRHKIATMAFAVIAAERGFRIEDNTRIVPQKGDELPDLVISKEDRFHDGAKRYKKVLRWAIEIVDSHDPVRRENWPGYEDTLRVLIKKAEEWCLDAHLEKNVVFLRPSTMKAHPLCLDSLVRLCERSLP